MARPKKVVLLVDDDPQALSVRKFLLDNRGYRVLTATSGEDAVIPFLAGGLDLVIVDLVMPRMDGNELVGWMKQVNPEVPALIVSSSVTSFERARNADAFLAKGYTSADLLERVRMMVARKRGPKKKPTPPAEAVQIAGAA